MKALRAGLYRVKKASFTSMLFLLMGIIMLIPLVMLVPYPSEYTYAYCFIIPSVITLLLGFLLCKKNGIAMKRKPFGRQHETVVVVMIWAYAFLIRALPFVISGDLDLTEALFAVGQQRDFQLWM